MRHRALRGVLLSLAMTLILALPALAYDDTAGHWGEDAIDRWSGEEILQGYGGQFRPDDPITRGELAVILDRLMDYQTLSDAAYPDVEGDSWYEEAVLGAAAANILQGDGTALRPLDPITRQEAAVLLGRALGVTENAAGLEGFTDAGEAANWATGYLGGMAQAGILNGYQGKIMPTATITRAEVAQLLDNAVAARYHEGGSYTADAAGNVIVSAAGVTLSDMTIDGNLIAAEGIGDGDLVLDNVTVKGTLVVRGGGEHSIIIKGNSSISTVTAERRDGGVRLAVEDDASVEVITISDGSDAVIVAGTVGTLKVDGAQAQVTVAGTVGSVTVSEQAQGASITVSGGAKVDNLTAAAPDTAITVGKGGTVERVTANGTGTTVSGAGKVENVTANADNVAVSTPNTKVEASEGTSGVTAGDKDVAGGSSATTPGTSTGSSSSGGSSGGGSSVSSTVATVGGVGYSSLEAAVAAIPEDAEWGDLYLVDDYALMEDITIPDGWTLGINEGVTLTIPETVTLDNLYGIMNYGTINGGGTLRSGNTIWNRGIIDCTVVNYQPEGSDWAVEYYQYAQWNGSGWTLAPLPHMENETNCAIFTAFNFEEDLNGSDTALAEAIDCINAIPQGAGYTFHLLEVRCQLTVNTPLTLPVNTSLALMGGEGRGITIEEGGSILNGNVEIITFEGYPVAQLTVKNGGTLTGELYITGNIEECLVVKDGATVKCTLFHRNTQEEEYQPFNGEAEGEAAYGDLVYPTLEEALNAAQADGGEVFLLRDVIVDGSVTIPQRIFLLTQGSNLTVNGTLTVNGHLIIQTDTAVNADALVITSGPETVSKVTVEYGAVLNVNNVIDLDGELHIDGTGVVAASSINMDAGAFYYHSITANDDGGWTIPNHPTIDAEDFSRVNCALNFPDLGTDNDAVRAYIDSAIAAAMADGNYGNYYLELRNNYTLEAGQALELPNYVTLLVRDSSDDWQQEKQTPYLITIEGTLTGGKLDFASSGFEGFVGHTSLVIKNGGTVSCNQYWLEGDDKLVVEAGGTLTVPADTGWMYLVDGMNLVVEAGADLNCSSEISIWPDSTLTLNGTLTLADAIVNYEGTINGGGTITGSGTLQSWNGSFTGVTVESEVTHNTEIPQP